jgi:hypothetical protein
MIETHWFHAENVLTRHLKDWRTVDEISEALRTDPLAGLKLAELSLMERHELLIAEKTPLLPTIQSLRVAMAMVAMHRNSLRIRNPALATGRRFVSESIEAAKSGFNFLSVPPAPGAFIQIVKGITGTAKTVTVKHTLRSLIGTQVIHHAEQPAALFKSAEQLSWLFVGMSHDGSRGGLLSGILLAVDAQLGTTYAVELPRSYKSVERLSGAVIALLHSLYLGILVIDEIQLLNLVDAPHAQLMQLFILSLANSGIPVVLVGNPFGFSWLPVFSQNLSRGIERPQVMFHPAGAVGEPNDDEWESIFTGIHMYYLLEQPVRNPLRFSALLKMRSGGIPRVALALWCSGQIEALTDGRVTLELDDIEAVYRSESFADMRMLCDGFANRDPTLLMRWRDADIPVDFYAAAWGKPLGADAATQVRSVGVTVNSAAPTDSAKKPKESRARSAAAALKAAQTRQKTKQEAREKLLQSLPSGDMRLDGMKRHALDSLDELMKEIEANKGK